MAISEQMLAMLLALHAPVGYDAARTLGPDALAQPSGGVVLADSSSASHKVKLKDFSFGHTQDKASTTLDSKLGDIKGESVDDKHKSEIDLQHTNGQGGQKGDGVQPRNHDAPGQ